MISPAGSVPHFLSKYPPHPSPLILILPPQTMEQATDREKQGWDWIDLVHGETGHAVLSELAETSPELVQYIVGFGYGEVYQQSQLDLPTRQLVIVSSLIAIGHAPTQLKVHMRAAMNVGCTFQQLTSLIHLLTYFLPDMAIETAREQLDALDVQRSSDQPDEPFSNRKKHLIRLAAMFAGAIDEQLVREEVRLALKEGVLVQEIKSQILLMLLYAGFPAAMNAMAKLKVALAEAEDDSQR